MTKTRERMAADPVMRSPGRLWPSVLVLCLLAAAVVVGILLGSSIW